MVGESGTSHTSTVYRYYKCVNTKKRPKSCNKKAVKKQWIEDLVVDETMKLLMNDVLLEQLTDKIILLQAQENTQLPLLRKQLKDVERGINNLLNAIQQGILTSSTKQRLDELEQRKSDIELAILEEETQSPLLTREQILFWFHKFRGIDVSDKDQRQRLIDCFVNAIYLYDDKMVLTFNFKDETKHISFDDIKNT